MPRSTNKADLSDQTKINQKANERRLLEQETNNLYKERNRLVARLNRDGTLGEKSAERLNDILKEIISNERKLHPEKEKSIELTKRFGKITQDIGKQIQKQAKDNKSFNKDYKESYNLARDFAQANANIAKDTDRVKGYTGGVLDLAGDVTAAYTDQGTTMEDIADLEARHQQMLEEATDENGNITKADQDHLEVIKMIIDNKKKELQFNEEIAKGLGWIDSITGGLVSGTEDLLSNAEEWGVKLNSSGALMAVMAYGTGKALVAVFSLIGDLMSAFAETFDKVGETFGAMGAREFADDMMTANVRAIQLGLSMEDVLTAVDTLTGSWGMSMSESLAVTENVLEMSKLLGMSVEEGAGLFGILRKVGGLTTEQAEDFTQIAEKYSKLSNIAPTRIMKEIAGSAESVAKMTGVGMENMIETTAAALKLGQSLDDVAQIQSGMLDFQSSIEKEMTASLMLGKEINLQGAREAFMRKDQAEALRLMKEQIGDIKSIGELDPMQAEALADAMNMSVDGLARFITGAKPVLSLAERMGEVKGMSELIPDETMDTLTQMQNSFEALKAQLVKDLAPAFADLLTDMKPMVEKFIEWVQWIDENIGLANLLKGAIVTLTGVFFAFATQAVISAGAAMINAIALMWTGLMEGAAALGIPTGGASVIAALAVGATGAAAMAATIGDGIFPAGGAPIVSTREGAFQLSPNDDMLVAPGIAGGGKGSGAGRMIAENTGRSLTINNQLKEEIIGLRKDMKKYFASDGIVANDIGKKMKKVGLNQLFT